MLLAENVNIFQGLNNAVNPSSVLYKEGLAYVSDNSRIDKELVWNKGPNIANVAGSPTTAAVPGKGSTHFASLSILGSHVIAKELGNTDTIDEGPNGYAYYTKSSDYPQYWTGADDAGAGDSGIARPGQTTYPSIAVSGTGARQESGIYYYMATIYDATRDIESLPTPAVEHWVGRRYVGDLRQADVPVLSGITSSGMKIRWYRSKVIRINKGDTMQLGQANSPTDFYFIGEVNTGSSFSDYAHDSEIDKPENYYTGRGSRPPSTGTDALAAFQNRMFYFVDDVAFYSSAGRPEEVPQSYDLRIRHDYSGGVWTTGTFKNQLTKGSAVYTTLTQRPLLDTGIYAEAEITIKELAGQTVVRAKEIGDKLWVWTAKLTGYIVPTANYEGFRFVKVADGIGLCSPWTLAVTPYGIFGADAKGIWVIEKDVPRRLSDGVIDIDDSNKSTYCASGNLAASFGVWVDELKEYWWSVANVQIVYQADKGLFVGPYAHTLTGGCSYVLEGYSECYLTGGKTPTLATRTGIQTLKFWLGQKSLPSVKDKFDIEVLYPSITADQSITGAVYVNNIASETGATSTTSWSHTDGNLVGVMNSQNSGRYFEVSLSIPSACTSPISAINYTANTITRGERARR